MIIAETATHYRLITQPDHGDMVGQFAAHWGNERFSRPEPYHAMTLLACAHDDGWWEWDLYPHLGPNGNPINFNRMPRENPGFTAGIEGLLKKDAYAAFLNSMHYSGLRRQRYGTETTMPMRQDEYTEPFVNGQEELQKRLKEELRSSGPYADYVSEDRIWFNYKQLQVWDRLGLYFGCNYQPPEDSLAPVPIALQGEDTQLRLYPLGDSRIRFDPYPFDASPLLVTVRGRMLPKREYKSQEELSQEYFKAERVLFTFTVSK